MGTTPPWFGKKRQDINRRSAKMETDHARATGGQRQAGSGSSRRAPQDVRGRIGEDGEGFLDQHKFTDKESFRLVATEFLANASDAHLHGREGRFVIEFPKHGLKLYVTEADD